MEIRKASVQDLGQIMQVYDKARKFMRENGNAAIIICLPGRARWDAGLVPRSLS